MIMKLIEDIRSVTELKRKTREILDQVRQTGRPVILTVNGKADAVLIDAKTFDKHLSASNMANILSVQLAATTLSVAYNNLSDSTGFVVPACLVTLSGSNVVNCLNLPHMVGPASVAACSGNNCASANGFITIGALRAAAKASLGTDSNTTKQTPQRGYQECLKVLLDEANNNGNPPSPSNYNCPLSSTLAPTPCPFTSPY